LEHYIISFNIEFSKNLNNNYKNTHWRDNMLL